MLQGGVWSAEKAASAQPIEIGKGRMVREGRDAAILSFGARLEECVKTAALLEAEGIDISVADARFAKPLDEALITQLIETHPLLLTVEEGADGGFGAHVLTFAARAGLLTDACRVLPLTLPDSYQAHAAPHAQYAEAGLNAEQIVDAIRQHVRARPAAENTSRKRTALA